MTLDLDELERLAKAAKKGKRKSEWVWDDREVEPDGYVHIPQGSTLVGLVQLGDTYEGYQADCDFMQGANPWAVLALVERVRLAEEWARKGLYSYHGGRCSMAGGLWPGNPRECESPICRQWAEDLLP